MSEYEAASSCVIVPFYNRVHQVAECLGLLLEQAGADTHLLLVDDASSDALDPLSDCLLSEKVHLIRHACNEGVSAARNSALHWCKARGYELVIMIDSDCIPGGDFVQTHLDLHKQYPKAACIGAGIVGQGQSVWAKLDGITSWVHAAPELPRHEVVHPYHLPTTNFSVKTAMLPDREFVFDERLYTGEDCLLIREYRSRGLSVLFNPLPAIRHRDRERLADVVRHHYKWGHHQYFIQLGRDISGHVFNPAYRVLFLTLFLPLWPFFALAGAVLNVRPWLSTRLASLVYFPGIYCLWLAKGIAVMEAAIRPNSVLRAPRTTVHYLQCATGPDAPKLESVRHVEAVSN